MAALFLSLLLLCMLTPENAAQVDESLVNEAGEVQVEPVAPGEGDGAGGEEKSADYYRRSNFYYAGRRRGGVYRSRGLYGSGLIPPGTVRTRVTVQKRILRPVAAAPLPPPLPAVDNFEGSYVAVSGRPGQRTVHAVNGRGSVAIEPGVPPLFLDYDDGGVFYPRAAGIPFGTAAPGLPKCSYTNTDFFGDDVGDGRGITAADPYDCKRACIDDDRCRFWTFRRGWDRNCYLKRGNQIGDLRPEEVIRSPGFVSGTVSDDCVCLRGEGGRICPTRRRGGTAFPWRRSRPRFDYDDDDRDDYEDYDDSDSDDGRDREVATSDGDRDAGDGGGSRRRSGTGRRRNRNRGSTGRRRRNRNRSRDNDDDLK